jgi:hypothetical protein
MDELPARIDALLDLRARILAAEMEAGTAHPPASAAERFDRRTRMGALRHRYAHAVRTLREQIAGDGPEARHRFATALLLVDEVVQLRREAATGDDHPMHAAMAEQAHAELRAEVAGMMGARATAATPAVRPALRLVHPASA